MMKIVTYPCQHGLVNIYIYVHIHGSTLLF